MKKLFFPVLVLFFAFTARVQAESVHYWAKDPFPKKLLSVDQTALQFVQKEANSDCVIEFSAENDPNSFAEATYVLTAAYPVVQDGISLRLLKLLWFGQKTSFVETLAMDGDTYRVFKALWGEPDRHTVMIHSADELLRLAWDNRNIWAIIPFDRLDPRWKVLAVDGKSPFQIGFSTADYPLTVRWRLAASSNALCQPQAKLTNFDTSRLTTLTLTGTTALVRRLAYAIEEEGAAFPVKEIAPVLSGSDITHVSNEASFFEGCPPGIPLRREARFCSLPSYFGALEEIGADVMELTGNHNLDWGVDAYLESLALTREKGLAVYGGGMDASQAELPLFIEHHGNRIALLGCNAVGPEAALAQSASPGALRCDLEKLMNTVKALQQDGWLCVVTFQHFEYEDYSVPPVESYDFLALAEAGPAVISGSQAHVPQGFTFVDDTFIHYGLGNLLFDQTSLIERDSFFDRHYFYSGKYIGNALETIRLEESMQVRFLTGTERTDLLNTVLAASSWDRVFP